MGGGGGGEVLRRLGWACGSSVGSQTQRRWSRRSAGAERPHAKPATDWLQPGSPRASLQLESDEYSALRVRKWVSEGEWGPSCRRMVSQVQVLEDSACSPHLWHER